MRAIFFSLKGNQSNLHDLVGDFKNTGKKWCPKGNHEKVQVHDFSLEGGKVAPYGVYDLTQNSGW